MADTPDIQAALDQVARGQTEAFARIVHAYGLQLRSYLASEIHRMDDVDDLAQEVFLSALTGLSTYRRGEDFGAWLRGIARNKMLVYFRSQSRRGAAMRNFRERVATLVHDELERRCAADEAETIEQLLGCVAKLPEKMRRVVRGGLEGDKPVQLAEALSTSVGVIYNLHHRANILLRECLRKRGML